MMPNLSIQNDQEMCGPKMADGLGPLYDLKEGLRWHSLDYSLCLHSQFGHDR